MLQIHNCQLGQDYRLKPPRLSRNVSTICPYCSDFVLIPQSCSPRDYNNRAYNGFQCTTTAEEEVEGKTSRADKDFDGYPTGGNVEGGEE